MKAKIGVELTIDFAHSLKMHDRCEPKHGHTAKVIVEIEGEVRGGKTFEDNVVMDFDKLRAICERILKELDHRDLDDVFSFPTAENIAKWIFDKLKDRVPLRSITVFEGEGKWCTVLRSDINSSHRGGMTHARP